MRQLTLLISISALNEVMIAEMVETILCRASKLIQAICGVMMALVNPIKG
jgi:hypothetical protein